MIRTGNSNQLMEHLWADETRFAEAEESGWLHILIAFQLPAENSKFKFTTKFSNNKIE